MTNLASAGRQIQFARETTFRDVFKPSVVGKFQPTLSDEDIVLAFLVSKERVSLPEMIMGKLPAGCRDHFKGLQEMRISRSHEQVFFTHFVLFAKSPDDGMLIGFSADELYYVLAAWDQNGFDLWQPNIYGIA